MANSPDSPYSNSNQPAPASTVDEQVRFLEACLGSLFTRMQVVDRYLGPQEPNIKGHQDGDVSPGLLVALADLRETVENLQSVFGSIESKLGSPVLAAEAAALPLGPSVSWQGNQARASGFRGARS